MSTIIKTQIEINATPETIWNILSNFEAYEKWNPFITSIKGILIEGTNLQIIAGGMSFKPTILRVKQYKEIRWLGKLVFSGLFDGEHSFQIIDNKNGTSTFKHKEYFSGILVTLFKRKLEKDTKAGFIEMNQKLKHLAETEDFG